ncbi:MAG: hypothetical protein P8M72_02950 [Gammaproteobacteria bacterium]|nr:hypothetical protein [Gammaproteobacteria bacterium]
MPIHLFSIRTGILPFIISGLLLVPAISTAASNPPDFSGAWTTYRGNPGAAGGPSRFMGGELNLVPAAEQARQDFISVTEGTNHGAGNSCVGGGMPGSMLGSGGYPMEILQRPEQLFVIYEAHNEIRRLYIDDEAQNPDDFFAERNGYSSAHWEGDRLIVETTRLKTQVDSRYPHSNQATIREEYYFDESLTDGTRVLAADMTMTDPLWLEEPLVTTKRWQELSDYHVLTYECTEPVWLDEMEVLYEEAGLEMIQE